MNVVPATPSFTRLAAAGTKAGGATPSLVGLVTR